MTAELRNLAAGCMAAGDDLSAKICLAGACEIERLRESEAERTGKIDEALAAEAGRLQSLITKLRLEFFGTITPHPAQGKMRELWDEMIAAEAEGGKNGV